jgi:hypothetical protein
MELTTDAIGAKLAHLAVDSQSDMIATIRGKSSHEKTASDHLDHGGNSEIAC